VNIDCDLTEMLMNRHKLFRSDKRPPPVVGISLVGGAEAASFALVPFSHGCDAGTHASSQRSYEGTKYKDRIRRGRQDSAQRLNICGRVAESFQEVEQHEQHEHTIRAHRRAPDLAVHDHRITTIGSWFTT